jgi:hypothetical protein
MNLVGLGVACAILLLPGCNSTASRGGHDGGSDSGAGGDAAVIACAAGQSCPTGFICVPDPRATCAAGSVCPNVCLSGSALCLTLVTPDSGPMAQCPPGQDVVTCRPNSCEGSNDCAACVDSTGATCDPANPCPAGQLCVPLRACASAGGCGSVCVVP